MDIKQETTDDLLMLIIQQVNSYWDHKSKLSDELDYISGLIDQLNSRISLPVVLNTVKEEKEALDKVMPEYLLHALEDLRYDRS